MIKGGNESGPKKIGSFLKELRKEKGITQEQFAEVLSVSGRTVSRWETGSNMPDISLLVNIAEYFDVSIPEIINGEKKSENMNEEVKEVAETLSDYANAEKETIIKNIRMHSILGTGALAVCMILELTNAVSTSNVFELIFAYAETLVYVAMVMILLHTTGLLTKIRKKNEKIKGIQKGILMIIGAVAAFVIATILKLFLNSLGIF